MFLDAPVKGLAFSTASGQGVTDSQGTFEYRAGEQISFSLGGVEIGSAQAGEIVPISALNEALDLAMVLQSLDLDDSEAIIDVSGITLPAAAAAELERVVSGDIDAEAFLDQGAFDEIKTHLATGGSELPYRDTPVSREDAVSHLLAQLDSGAAGGFSESMLNNKFLMSESVFGGLGYALRFQQGEQVRAVSMDPDNTGYGRLNWSINASGEMSIEYPGYTCTYRLLDESEGVLNVYRSCTDGREQFRRYLVSRDLSPAMFANRTYDYQNGAASNVELVFQATGSGFLRIGGEAGAAFTVQPWGGEDVAVFIEIEGDGEVDLIALMAGDLSAGTLMTWSYDAESDAFLKARISQIEDGLWRVTNTFDAAL